jgi:hypothetical protein
MPSIFEKLGFSNIGIGEVQSVDEMMVIPIVGENRGALAMPPALKFERTQGYGNMVFTNSDDYNPAIVPANYMVRGKYAAQDHASCGAEIVPARSTLTIDTACCIEQRQGGYLKEEGNIEDILPIKLRKVLVNYSKRKQKSFQKLWGDISNWLKGLKLSSKGIAGGAHLNYFYDTPEINQQLEQFAAEFEPVQNQIGAIVLFAGIPVGIEIMPTSDHWKAYWKQLIRGSYGAELIRARMLNKSTPTALVLPDIPEDASPEKVKDILSNFTKHLQEEVLPILDAIEVSDRKNLSTKGNMSSILIQTKHGGGGDLVTQNNSPVYLSIVL